jgi:hypothetical protein
MNSENGSHANNGHANGNGKVIRGATVARGEMDEATVLEPYPEDRYQAVREGRMSTEEFVKDLVKHVREGIDRTATST